MSKYAVGDKVMVTGRDYGPAPATVVKVGRTLVQVEQANRPGHWNPYRMDTGECTLTRRPRRLLTMAEWDDHCECGELVKRLRAAGIALDQRPATRDLAWLRRVVEAAEGPS